MARRPITARVINAARHNIRRAQLSRVRTREPRSPGRVYRSRALFSRPASRAGRTVIGRRTR